MRKAVAFIALTAAFATVAATGALLLIDSSEEETGLSRGADELEADGPRTLPGADETAAASALEVAEAEIAAAHDANAEAAAAPEPGTPFVVSGVVLDDLDKPVAGARVALVPDNRTLAARGWKRDGQNWLAGRTLADFAPTTTDAEGRFSVDGRLVRSRIGQPREKGLPNYPVLVVRAAGFAPYGYEFRDFRDAKDDVGTLRLQRGASLQGRIFDERGQPLAGAKLRFNPHDNDPTATQPTDIVEQMLYELMTGEDGRFELIDMPARLDIRGTASAPERLNHNWDAFKLEPGEMRYLDPVSLAWGGIVAGRVLDPAGQPLAGATVVAVDVPLQQRSNTSQYDWSARSPSTTATDPNRATTDAAGHFEFRGLAGTSRSLIAHAPNLAWSMVHDVLNGASGVVLRLGEPATLEVSIVDRQTRQPVAATLEARLQAWGVDTPALDVAPGENGKLLVRDPGLGGTHLVVTATAYAKAELDAPGVQPGVRSPFLVELDRGFSLSGQVLDTEEHPLPEASLSLQRRDDAELNQHLNALGYGGNQPSGPREPSWSTLRNGIAPDAEGRFVFDALAPGDYRVVAQAPARVRTESEVVSTSAPLKELRLLLPAAGVVRGVIVDASDKPLPRRSVRLAEVGAKSSSNASSDTAGRFVFRDVTPGAFMVSAGSGSTGVPVTVVAGEEAQVRVQLDPPATLDVFATCAGQAVADVKVWANPSRGGGQTVKTDERGRATFKLTPSKVTVSLTTPGGGSAKGSIELLPGESRTLSIELGAGRIECVVKDSATGNPVASVPVAAVRLNEEGERATMDEWDDPLNSALATDAEGRIALEHLEPGTWEVWAGGKGWTRAKPVKVTLEAGGAAATAELEVRRPAIVRGRVMLPDGRPATRTRLMLIRQGGAQPERVDDSWTTTEGRFEFSNFGEAGSYVVAVPKQYWSSTLRADEMLAQSGVEAIDGQAVEVTVTLPALP